MAVRAAQAGADAGELVSTVIPCFNAAPFVERAIASALAQRDAAVEVVVVDDGSTDASAAIVAALAERDARIRLIRHTANDGPAPARNDAIAHARGRYLAFLDADDQWRADKLARQLAVMRRTRAGLVFTGVEVQDIHGRRLGQRHVPPTVAAEQLLVHNVIATSSVLIDRRRVPDVRMPELRMRQDLATWHGLLSAGVIAVGLDEPLVIYTKHRGGMSANKLAAAQAHWHLYRDHLHRSVPTAATLLVRYAMARAMRI